jgi:hypothetical protein
MKLNLNLAFLLAALVNGATGADTDDTEPLDLGTAANYVMLAKTGITGGANDDITGDVGISPAAASTITGFALKMDTSGQHSTSAMVRGGVMAADYAGACAAALTKATTDVNSAIVDASTRTATGTAAAALGGLTLEPGVYKYAGAVSIATDLTFDGGIDDVWIIYAAGAITVAANAEIILVGGAQAKNIFFTGATSMTVGADASIAGIMAFKTTIGFGARSSLNGRAFSQTAITLGADAKMMTEEETFC